MVWHQVDAKESETTPSNSSAYRLETYSYQVKGVTAFGDKYSNLHEQNSAPILFVYA